MPQDTARGSDARSSHSQTLSRGIRTLEILSEHPEPLTIAQVAEELGVHRSVAYRILRTLEEHGVVERDPAGRMRLGPRMAALARGVARDLQTVALPELTAIANEFGATAFIAVLDRNEIITLVSVEPRTHSSVVAQRPGTRHPINNGGPAIAVQMQLPAARLAELDAEGLAVPEAKLRAAAADGYATSSDEVIAGLSSIAVPLQVPGGQLAALAVVYAAASQSEERLARRLRESAHLIAAGLS